ncbi:sulfite reductase subunit alpha [Undibacterium sp. Di24W]|uniref:sulfite reductase subunit alpha n=1 Tax=Undibacterium sp. Di24W TaxID=3413033 RepID=UPI003BF2C60B
MQSQEKQLRLNALLLIALSISVVCLFAPLDQHLSISAARLSTAFSLLISYALFYYWIQVRHKRAHQSSHQNDVNLSSINQEQVLIVYASQTGYAEQLATQTQNSLHQGGMQTRLCNISQLNAEVLQQAHKILFLVSTTGEGDAPDSAAAFTRNVMGQNFKLTQLHYAVLALGDRNYQAYCAFGHQLDHWLHQQGAQTLFDTVEVDNGDDGALRHWQHHLGVLSGHTDLADWHQAEYENWILSERRLLNPDSQGNPVYQLRIKPSADTPASSWQAGDIAEILPRRPGSDQALPHREYSIASIPQDGAVELIVRQMQQADGSLGLGSGWLTHYADIGNTIALRLRSNRSFHSPVNNCPLILVGNGTGIAGLRAHLKHRAQHGADQNWLFFGERNRSKDFFCQTEIEEWQADGTLSKLDLAFSRDQTQRLYVQDKLREQAIELRTWVAQGAAIYVCGSLEGMAGGVDAALRDILGEAGLERMREEGLYRRDVY